MAEFDYGIKRIISEIAAIGTGQIAITPTNNSFMGVPAFGYKDAANVSHICALLDAPIRVTGFAGSGGFVFNGTSSSLTQTGMSGTVSFADIEDNAAAIAVNASAISANTTLINQKLTVVTSDNTLSGAGTPAEPLSVEATLDNVVQNGNILSRTLDAIDGDITGVLGGAKSFDAASASQLKGRTLSLLPVKSVVNSPPSGAVAGDRHLIGVGTGDFLNHNDEIAEMVSRRPDPTSVTLGETTLLRNNKSVAYSPDDDIYVGVASDGFSYSYDGITYYAVSPPSVENWTKVIRVDAWKLYIACNTSGTTFSFATSKNGKNWTGRIGPVKAYKGLAYNPNTDQVFAASSDGTPRLSYTYDGITWDDTGVVISEENWTILDFSYKHMKLVCSNTTGTTNQFGYSDDGLAWSYSSPGAQSWESIRAFKDRVGLCSLDGTYRFVYTEDLINWITVEVVASDGYSWKGFDYGDGIVFMVSANGTVAYSLDDGDNWTIVTAETTDYRDCIWAQKRGEFTAIGRTGTHRSLVTNKITDWMIQPTQNGNSVYVQSLNAYYEYINNTWVQPTNRPVLTDYGKSNMRAVFVAETNTTDASSDSALMTMVTGDAEFLSAFDLNRAYLLDVELMAMMLDTSYTRATTIWHGKMLRYPDTGDVQTFLLNALIKNDAGYGVNVFDVTPVFVWGSSGLEVTVEHTGEASRTYDAAWQLSVRLQYLDNGEPVC